MYILRTIINSLIIFCFLLSCKSRGPLSPEEAFNSLKSAYQRSDAGDIIELLSERSKEKIKLMVKMISTMNEFQLKALSERFGATVDHLRNLSMKDYLSLQLSMGKRIGEDTLKEITQYKIIGIDVENEKAIIRIENGMELFFVKEGPYWKFDMEELSLRD